MNYMQIPRFFFVLLCVTPILAAANPKPAEIDTSLTQPGALAGGSQLPTHESSHDLANDKQPKSVSQSSADGKEDDCE
jgi:hypothetical protein